MKNTWRPFMAGALCMGVFLGGAEVVGAAKASFNDVPASHWAKASIEGAVAKGYFKGYADGTFRPQAHITRAEFAVLLSRISSNVVENDSSTFADIAGHWGRSGIEQSIGMGFLTPSDYSGGFKPDEALTRREMAKWMASGLAARNEGFKQALSDTKDTLVPVAEYYKGGLNPSDYSYLSVVLGTGLMTGYLDGTFGPSQPTTRAEVAVILSRYQQVQLKEASDYQDLEEMREVGLTGTNLLSATPHVYTKSYETERVSSFDKFANKPYPMLYNRGTMTIHRMIVVDAVSKTESKNLYGKMFMSSDLTVRVVDDHYNVFLEATVIPHDNTSLTNGAFPDSTLYNFTKGRGFESKTARQYGLTLLPVSDHFIKTGFFKKDVARTFWFHNHLNKDRNASVNGSHMGRLGNGTLTSWAIPMSK
ncbi:S-layer homology domain-containing protein [Paenibacillus sp. F411]|uniref:S-layer homology domain-containing protein n=1 Tax=Paenibacillus sp. F411 TaxID=2820239 RepID=UPI001AAE989E|nr:S-layer homology domain-containing protein [Paenibacillus sp. F411]MBO2943830.1 S-layer homology domain-containing protein [Paenibacillus sp. F411]